MERISQKKGGRKKRQKAAVRDENGETKEMNL
jgi:hypothetical protein